jgi:HSP20 family protein
MIYKSAFGFPAWNFRRAFEEFDRMRRQMDRFASGFESGPGENFQKAGVFPALNLTEDDHNYYIRAELPGVVSEDLDIQATGKNLSISGVRKNVPEAEGARYHRREREAGKFARVFTLPGIIVAEKIKAAFSNGVLTITIPKAEESKPRKISIS